MFGADAASDDVGLEIVFGQDGRAGKAPEHGDLPNVIQRISDRALEEASVEPWSGSEEAR